MELALDDHPVQDVVETVRASLRPLAAEKGLALSTSVPVDIPPRTRRRQACHPVPMNLADNSLKVTREDRAEGGTAR